MYILLWLRYIDDILEVVKKDQVQQLTDHVNQVDKSGCIKFTCAQESEGSLAFLDIQIIKKDDSVKLLVYRKPTHTDQYLNYQSHHPLHQKLGVIRTLFDRKDLIVTEEEDKIVQEKKVQDVLQMCGYPDGTFEKVKQQKQSVKQKKAFKKNDANKSKGMVVLPYVKGVSEKVYKILKSYNISTALRPHKTLREPTWGS